MKKVDRNYLIVQKHYNVVHFGALKLIFHTKFWITIGKLEQLLLFLAQIHPPGLPQECVPMLSLSKTYGG